ncbi:hypothetical protein AB6A40_008256 [Gnathostoma spinigerum]|uniref:Importin subunit alpha n=1 Tax=Gnathostoma spinigerum TaxID=75299 RepID=A0ABD6EY67_9BILA
MDAMVDISSVDESTASQISTRESMYKNRGMTSIELRKRRETDAVQLRKNKRDDAFSKRRNIDASDSFVEDNDDENSVTAAVFRNDDLLSLLSDDPKLQGNILHLLRKHACAPYDDIIRLGLVPVIVSILKSNDSLEIRRDAAWLLSDIVSGTTAHTRCVVEADAVPTFIALLSSDDEELRKQCLVALGNIAGDQNAYRTICIDNGIMPALLNLVNASNSASECRNAVWTISNVCRGKKCPEEYQKAVVVLPALSKLLFSRDAAVVADACRALTYLSDGPDEYIECVIQAGVVRRLVELLLHPDHKVCSSALMAVGNIVTGTNQQTQAVLNCSALGCLGYLLQNSKETLEQEVCWTLSNILAGNRKQIQAVIDAHLLPPLISVLSSGKFKSRKEACWAVSNAIAGGSVAQIATIVNEGAVHPLCDLLTVMEPRIVDIALTALENILKAGEVTKNRTKSSVNPYCELIEEAHGLEKLEFLQQSPNFEIYVKAFDLIETFFADNENDETVDVADQGEMHSETANFAF